MDPFSSVEAIYFDLDDTLCAYWDASKAALRTAFEKHGPKGCSPEDMVGHWATVFRRFSPTIKGSDWYKEYLKKGEPTRVEQMRMTLAEMGVDDVEKARSLSQCYFEERDRNLKLFPDAIEVLTWASSRFPLGLITNGPADVQRQEIATLGIEPFFKQILIEGEMGEGKPLARVFHRAEEFVKKKPEQLLFVGNSYGHDIFPAIEVGWKTVWVRRPSDVPPSAGKAAVPEEIPPDAPAPNAIISDLLALKELLAPAQTP